MAKEVLGIDIGGVISEFRNDGRTAEVDPDAYLRSPAVHGACATIAGLQKYFDGRIFLVSKCRWRMQLKTRNWLRHHQVYEQTGILPDQVWFCLERHEKAEICKVLGITHFIDDRLEVLSHLMTVPSKILFRPSEREVARFAQFLPDVTRVESWGEISGILVPAP